MCIPKTKILKSLSSSLIINLEIYYSSSIYEFKEFSLNFWIKLSNSLNYYNVLTMGIYSIYYNSLTARIIVKDTTQYIFGQFYNNFLLLGEINTNNFNYWLPVSINYKQDVSGTYSVLQVSVGDQYGSFNPTSIITLLKELEIYFDNYQLNNLKIWDNFIDINTLKSSNYMYKIFNFSLEKFPPKNLFAYYLLTEGYIFNRGSSNLVFTHNTSSLNWVSLGENNIPLCLQNEYYDNFKKLCLSK